MDKFLSFIVVGIAIFCLIFVLAGGKPTETKRRSRKRRAVGVIDEHGFVHVGSQVMPLAQAKRRGVVISGYYEPSKLSGKSRWKV